MGVGDPLPPLPITASFLVFGEGPPRRGRSRPLDIVKDVVPERIGSIVQLTLNPGTAFNMAHGFGSNGVSPLGDCGGEGGARTRC